MIKIMYMYQPETTRHSVYNINYHMVWISKYRKPILTQDIADEVKTNIAQIAKKHKYRILALEIMPDHLHLFLSTRPNEAPATTVKKIKGALARKLFKKFPELKKNLYKGHLWAPSYFVGTAGHVSSGTIRRYIEECQNL